ncbi:MAG: hypothetical protein NTW61_08995 [Candidatus Melainabacteria bacterium]|nr:hypothetical protein [Candidatus Melainabacteria bacterium]
MLSSIVVYVFSWLVCQEVPVWAPPDTPHKPRGTPYGGTALNATPLCHKGMDEGMFFLPLRWTERIGSCRANAMVVPTGGYAI